MGIKKVGLNRNIKPQSIIEKLLFLDFAKGLKTTIKHLFRKTITVDFPYEVSVPTARFRGVHGLRNVDGTESDEFKSWVKKLKIKPPEEGETRCIACKFCQAACPVPELFTIKAEKLDVPEDHPHHGLKVLSIFDMDLSKCMFCGLCTQACPTDCIIHTDIYDLSSYTRKSWVLNKEELSRIADDFVSRRGKEKFDEKSNWKEDQQIWPDYDIPRAKAWDGWIPSYTPNYTATTTSKEE
ncbi:MAG: NADH-quinone oxidoreductase subunit I [Aquificota bacterium]|nr:MAG: NADH-quinone oxidoreductase subunit I [Aquificota bacterium]